MKISVIIPVYNAEEYILESVTSLLKQTYKNFEIIIIDDGSTDHTREVLKTIQDERVKYIYQENSDQLNALLNATDYITGEIVCLFHADDILASNYSFERNIDFLKKNSDLEGLYCDLIQIDENSNVKGIYLKTPSKIGLNELKKVLLLKGSNLIPDHFFVKKEFFSSCILNNYIYDNTIYWIKEDKKVAKLKKVESWYKYRVHTGNYANSESGKFVLTTGSLRTTVKLAQNLLIPFPRYYRKIFNIFFGIFKVELPIISFNISGLNYRLVKETIKFYNENKIPENFYYGIILNYYRNVKNRTVEMEGISEEDVFFGKDSRSFYKLMTENRLPNIYKRISEESVEGFNKIQVNNKTEEQCMLNILRFLNICCPVIIKR